MSRKGQKQGRNGSGSKKMNPDPDPQHLYGPAESYHRVPTPPLPLHIATAGKTIKPFEQGNYPPPPTALI
jgi:hypothetical protein